MVVSPSGRRAVNEVLARKRTRRGVVSVAVLAMALVGVRAVAIVAQVRPVAQRQVLPAPNPTAVVPVVFPGFVQQGPKLVGTGAFGVAVQGASVSLSAEGDTAVVGGDGDVGGVGAVWVWRRSGGIWLQDGPKLVGEGWANAALQGWSVALSGGWHNPDRRRSDDNLQYTYGIGVGAVWVFTRNNGRWTQQGPKLVAPWTGFPWISHGSGH